MQTYLFIMCLYSSIGHLSLSPHYLCSLKQLILLPRSVSLFSLPVWTFDKKKKMRHSNNSAKLCPIGLPYVTISFLFLLCSSSIHVRFKAEGRASPESPSIPQTVNDEEKMIMRSQIGSRPPRCEKRCSTCAHCEAIQVPTNPQANHGNRNYSRVSSVAYARGDDNSNYKPMSWKCKCGNFIFNP
ncbi:hypothetical protein Tsubulata_039506 [Turnera subulata]|uniref:Epidermal patterning factor-like protein n=1 Tax=Turnera subulata TaxID=218843 RepID=A0A9Q0FEH5_9ROSI|nr:hypothetical protein Tsubulata_039506 [Turnera subulata]